MEIAALVLFGVLACAGLYLIADFILWRLRGHVVEAVITGFQSKKSKGLALPVVSFEKKSGGTQEAPVQRIDRLVYVLNRPAKGDSTFVIYREEEPEKVRVYGMINLVAAVFICAPFIAVVGFWLDRVVIVGQVVYISIFGVIILAALAFLKLIQKNY